MPFKVNIGEKGKTFKLETETEYLIGKKLGETIEEKELKPELEGYELEITGTSDKAGFPGMKQLEGPALKRVLLERGFGLKKKQRKEGKRKRPKPRLHKGLRMKKTVRGNAISRDTIQINTKVAKQGKKKLEEIFAEQVRKPAEQTPEGQAAGAKPAEEKKENKEEGK